MAAPCIKWKYCTGLVDDLASQEHLGPPLEFKMKLYEFEQCCAALHEYMLTGPPMLKHMHCHFENVLYSISVQLTALLSDTLYVENVI